MSIPDFELLAAEDAAYFANHSDSRQDWPVATTDVTAAHTFEQAAVGQSLGAEVVALVAPKGWQTADERYPA